MHNIGILIFDNVELLDFAGPYEVFYTASRLEERKGVEKSFRVFTIGETPTIKVRGGLRVSPDYLIEEIHNLDILIIPGGQIEEILVSKPLKDFILSMDKTSKIVASVCTGSLILSKFGLLDGLSCTTHWEDLEELSLNPKVHVIRDKAFVDQGKYITSGGIASGISMSLYLVEKFLGKEHSILTAKQMEYPCGS